MLDDDDMEDDDSVYFSEDLISANPTAATGIPTASVMSSAADVCSQCNFTIDLRCRGVMFRDAFFHRIANCLLPAYGLISKARQHANGHICILTWKAVEPLLSALAPDLNAVPHINEGCAAKTKHYIVQPERRFGFSCDWISNFNSVDSDGDHNVIGVYPIDIALNGAAMRKDAASYHEGDRSVLLIRRSGSRAFTADASSALAHELGEVARITLKGTRTRYAEYRGTESVRDTIKLFVGAVGVVGYHGAGFVNALFTDHEVCAQEITTWKDAKSTEAWRSNEWLAQFNLRLHWNTYALPLSELLEANSVKDVHGNKDMDHFIKDLKWVHLTSLRASLVAHQLSTCLASEVLPYLQDAD